MVNSHCKIGKVTPKNNLVVLENPLNAWSKEAAELATSIVSEEIEADARMDAIVNYMHFSNGEALSYLNRHESCKIPIELLGEIVKKRTDSMKHRSEAREMFYEILDL